MQEYNGFDNIFGLQDQDEVKKLNEAQNAMYEKIDHLQHKVFKQSTDGAELLELWKESLIMNPVVTPSSTSFGAGIEQGKRDFIRYILLTIKSVEEKI